MEVVEFKPRPMARQERINKLAELYAPAFASCTTYCEQANKVTKLLYQLLDEAVR